MDSNLIKDHPTVAVFYSTVRGWPWGAPDYTWPAIAEKLLGLGIRVIVIVHPEALRRPEIQKLITLGCECYPQPPLQYHRGWISRIRNFFLLLTRPTLNLCKLVPSATRTHIFINQGGDIDLVFEKSLHSFLNRSTTTYDIFCHLASNSAPIPKTLRSEAIDLFSEANRCCFNSEWTRAVVETKLLTRFDNYSYFSYPIPVKPKAPLPWPAGRVAKFACVSRLDIHHKGLDVLLQALSDMRDTPVRWTLDIYGNGEAAGEDYLSDALNYWGLVDHVQIYPFQKDVESIWRDHHMLLLTSRYEGLGVSMLEALACGRPVMRTPYGGAKEWITDGVTGYTCPAADPELIRHTLQQALNQFEKWQQMGQNGFNHISQLKSDTEEKYYMKAFSQF